MNDKALRRKVAKLAYDNPELRPHLLPLLKKGMDATFLFNHIRHTWYKSMQDVWDEKGEGRMTGTAKTGVPLKVDTDFHGEVVAVEIWTGFFDNFGPNFGIFGGSVDVKMSDGPQRMKAKVDRAIQNSLRKGYVKGDNSWM